MIEFGSDFHKIEGFKDCSNPLNGYKQYLLLADGRQALNILITTNCWKRIWIPEYFCYDVVDSIRKTGVEVLFYEDYPGNDDSKSISSINFKKSDVLLRMNYFGLRGWRDNTHVEIPVIEDHSHSPFGYWAKSSNADWCIASLRKTLPIAEGGVLWSPKGKHLNVHLKLTDENKDMSIRRWQAMLNKSKYLEGSLRDKHSFRDEFVSTETIFDELPVSKIDEESERVLQSFDIKRWIEHKRTNWEILSDLKSNLFRALSCEDEGDYFSFVILCCSNEIRDKIRRVLIDHSIYPAILWQVPEQTSSKVRDISSRLLSIHCDARYSFEDIKQLKSIISKVINNV